jgi:protein-S-isoprenylcysteine O-methyltransferase Ste14
MSFWFYKPFAWNQIIAWSLLFLCLIPLGLGVYSLRTQGKPTKQREGDACLLAIDPTVFLLATAKADKQECTHFFGTSYQKYRQKTKRFIPYLF